MAQYVRVKDKATGKPKPNPITRAMAHALRDKYEIIEDQTETPAEEQSETPNAPAAGLNEAAKVVDAGEGVELANARKEYEELFGEKPHGRLQLKSLIKLNEEKRKSNQPQNA